MNKIRLRLSANISCTGAIVFVEMNEDTREILDIISVEDIGTVEEIEERK